MTAVNLRTETILVAFEVGPDIVSSYKRLSYTPWHALAEFVDNSTQSYANNAEALAEEFERTGEKLSVRITYDREARLLRIVDNAMGMDEEILTRSLILGRAPLNRTGRSRYGLGMKTAAFWFGDEWSIRTKKLGETYELTVDISEEALVAGNTDLPTSRLEDLPEDDHYTVIEIRKLSRSLQGRTLGKIKDFLRSMYRSDLRMDRLLLEWRGEPLAWDMDEDFAIARDGSTFKKDFTFEVDGLPVLGWVGVLDHGSRAKAGFSILHADRVVRGWPDSWRPAAIFGQLGGSNDLLNQRLTGELYLDAFEVTHTKDDILWMGDQEDQVEELLKEEVAEYAAYAKLPKSSTRPTTDLEVQAAVDALQEEMLSPEIIDTIAFTQVPAEELVEADVEAYVATVDTSEADFRSTFTILGKHVEILGYIAADRSPNDPYVVSQSTDNDRVLVIINAAHPHMAQITGSDNLLNYFRHCTYDAIAEWQARNAAGRTDPATIRSFKDRLLRVPFEIQMHQDVS